MMTDGPAAVQWIWLGFITAIGACVGSFLNVVIYRLPRDKSLVYPGSACPACDKPIRFYDNIPLVSWLALRGRCRRCKAPISIRYFLIELLTAVLFAGVYLWFFHTQGRQTGLEGSGAMQRFFAGGWLFYLAVMVLMAAFLAASAIDLELWIIPIQLCWFVSLAGLAAAIAAGQMIDSQTLAAFHLFPAATPKTAAMATGAGLGTLISLVALHLGLLRPSYEMDAAYEADKAKNPDTPEPEYNHRREILKEVVFLLPVVLCAVIAMKLSQVPFISNKWMGLVEYPSATYGFGALAGYFAGCAVVWATRIFGTLAFGKEAMGLGDVHLMGAAGAVIGPFWVVLAFFVAPFFGIAWALYQAIFKKIRQIPYGPFLSAAVFVVIIFHDGIKKLITNLYGI
jgi:leader peptidase (prepilin peptidase)/N-methyltransferase